MQSIKEIWTNLSSRYTSDQPLVLELWEEIHKNYSSPSRHYHDLSHIENMIKLAFEFKESIEDPDTILFSIFYHDIIYKATKKDNEEKSADLAVDRLKQLGISNDSIQKCRDQIIATKAHRTSKDNDTNFLIDFDLAVLGGKWDDYQNYYIGARKEYKIYPDFLYKPGRKKVLEHIIEMKNIYKTDEFRSKFEKKAKENLMRELAELS